MGGREVLRLEGIKKRFGNTPVLRGLDLSVNSGEFITILGSSGCGHLPGGRGNGRGNPVCTARVTWTDAGHAVPVDRPNAGAELIRAYGVERFFFGSGFPMWDPGLCLKEFLALDLRPGEQEKILHQNDREILGESS